MYLILPSVFSPSYPIDYSIGNYDERFGVSQEKFIKFTEQASAVWGKEAGLELFHYDSAASFKINLVFDERQEKVNERKQIKTKINALKDRYTYESKVQEGLQQNYDAFVSMVQQKTTDYNSQVAYLNNRGGAHEDEIERLKSETADIENMKASLEERRQVLNAAIDTVNSLIGQINDLAREYNITVSLYNGRWIFQSRAFEAGDYEGGKIINIFEFEDEPSLKLILIHEFGHALGFDHVKDPESIMYYKLEKQDLSNIHLSKQDLELVNKKFPQ